MAQSGFTPIVTYNTATASAVPVAGNLQQGELAVNVTDKKLYTKDSGGNVVNVGVGADATATLTNKTLTTPVLANPSYSGTTANGGTVTTIDINGGTIDATAIGSTTPAAGSFTTLSASGRQVWFGGTDYGSYLSTHVDPTNAPYPAGLAGYTLTFNTGPNSARVARLTIDTAGAVRITGPTANGSGNEGLTVDNNGVKFATRRDAGGGGDLQVGTPNGHNLLLMAGGSTAIRAGVDGAVTIPGILNIGNPSTAYALSVSGISGAHKVFLRRTDNNANGMALWTDAGGSFNLEYRTDADVAVSGPLFTVNYGGAVTIPGSLSITGTSLGFGTGAGGTVTQATSKSTAVTLNKACGQITMNNSAVGAGAEDGFYFYSDKLSANDVLLVTGQYDGTVNPANYEITVRQIYGPTNRALIYIKNRTAGSLSEAVVLNFVIIKGAIA